MSHDELLQWLRQRIAALTEQPVDAIDPDARMLALGLDSAGLVGLSGDIEEKLGRRIDPEIMYEHETLRDLAAFLATP